MQCHRGCGLEATYVNTRGKPCCSNVFQSCPAVRKKIGENSGATRRKNPVKRTDEYKAAQSRRIKEQWETGKRVVTEKTIENAKNLHTARTSAWNKGLTKDTSESVAKYATSQRGKKRKVEPLDIISRADPVYSDFKKYRNRVAVRTKKTYEQHKDEINPLNYPLMRAGIDGAYHLDHIISVRVGFENGMLIEEISAKENLQVIPWLDNVKKYDGKGLRKIKDSK